MAKDRDRYWRQFEDLGKDTVRENVRLGVFSGKRLKFAKAWLAEREEARNQEAGRLDAESASEQIAISRDSADSARSANDLAREANDVARAASASAREANDIARDAAAHARKANKIAATALAIAIIAVIVAIVTMVIGRSPEVEDETKAGQRIGHVQAAPPGLGEAEPPFPVHHRFPA